MKDKILKLWKDPVWSKIISVIILSSVTIIYNYIISLTEQTEFLSQLQNFFFFKVYLWILILLFFAIYIGYYLMKRIQAKKGKNYIYDPETLNLDKNLFETIQTKYINRDVVENLAYNTFSSNPFSIRDIDFINEIIEGNVNPNFEFINPELEKLKQDFIYSIEVLKECIDNNVFSTNAPLGESDTWLRIPREWELDRFWKAKNAIVNSENNAYHKWIEFIRKGRKTLKV